MLEDLTVEKESFVRLVAYGTGLTVGDCFLLGYLRKPRNVFNLSSVYNINLSVRAIDGQECTGVGLVRKDPLLPPPAYWRSSALTLTSAPTYQDIPALAQFKPLRKGRPADRLRGGYSQSVSQSHQIL